MGRQQTMTSSVTETRELCLTYRWMKLPLRELFSFLYVFLFQSILFASVFINFFIFFVGFLWFSLFHSSFFSLFFVLSNTCLFFHDIVYFVHIVGTFFYMHLIFYKYVVNIFQIYASMSIFSYKSYIF